MYRFNDPRSKHLRRQIRSRSTEYEKILWEYLRRKQIRGLRFRRNYQILNYYVDFYCPAVRLAVEVDGEIHRQRKSYDLSRDDQIQSLGITVFRFRNDEIVNDVHEVLNKIERFIDAHPPLGTGGGS